MARFTFLLAAAASLLLSAVNSLENSGTTVEDGIYRGVTVRVAEAVPKHLCHRILNSLEVRFLSTFVRSGVQKRRNESAAPEKCPGLREPFRKWRGGTNGEIVIEPATAINGKRPSHSPPSQWQWHTPPLRRRLLMGRVSLLLPPHGGDPF